MNSAQGTFRLLYEDAAWFMGKLLLLYVTLPLTVAWILVGISFDLSETLSTIAAPAYFFFIPFYGIMGFKSLLPIGVSLGSTRTQILRSFYGVGLIAVFVYVLIFNVLQGVIWTLYDQGISSVRILHPGILYSSEYQFLPYLWIDLMSSLVLFSGAFFIYSIMYRLGMKWTLIGAMIMGIAGMFLYYSGALDAPFDWISNLNVKVMSGFTVAGIIGLIALFATYPMMRNASLQPKANRE